MTGTLVDLTLHKHAQTKLAILVSDDGVDKNAVWIPLSQCEVAPMLGVGASKSLVLVTMPQWLATERGLV